LTRDPQIGGAHTLASVTRSHIELAEGDVRGGECSEMIGTLEELGCGAGRDGWFPARWIPASWRTSTACPSSGREAQWPAEQL
jgi:hypothetical protein